MTAGSGGRSPRGGSSGGRSRPTGRPTESESSKSVQPGEADDLAGASQQARRPSAGARRRARRGGSGRRLFAFDRRLGVRLVAGADEAGRGSLAGPLVAAGVLFDYQALTTRDLRSLSALNDSKQHTCEAREQLFPRVLRTAARVAVVSRCVRGIDARGLHRTNLAALRAAIIAATSGVPGEVICLIDGFPVAEFERP